MLIRIDSARFVLLTYKTLALYLCKESMGDHTGSDFLIKQDKHKKISQTGWAAKSYCVWKHINRGTIRAYNQFTIRILIGTLLLLEGDGWSLRSGVIFWSKEMSTKISCILKAHKWRNNLSLQPIRYLHFNWHFTFVEMRWVVTSEVVLRSKGMSIKILCTFWEWKSGGTIWVNN